MRFVLNFPVKILAVAFLISLAILLYGVDAFAGQDRIVKVAIYNYPPVVFKDNEGKYQGLQVEILEEIAKIEGWKLEYLHGNWVDCLNRLERNEVDLLLGIGYSENRATQYSYNAECLPNKV